MGRGWKIAAVVWGVFWAFVLVAATVPAHEAVSNLESWADYFDLAGVAKFLAAAGIDLFVKALATIGVIIAMIAIVAIHIMTRAQLDAIQHRQRIEEYNKRNASNG